MSAPVCRRRGCDKPCKQTAKGTYRCYCVEHCELQDQQKKRYRLQHPEVDRKASRAWYYRNRDAVLTRLAKKRRAAGIPARTVIEGGGDKRRKFARILSGIRRVEHSA